MKREIRISAAELAKQKPKVRQPYAPPTKVEKNKKAYKRPSANDRKFWMDRLP